MCRKNDAARLLLLYAQQHCGVLQRALAEQKVLWVKFSELQDKFQEDKDKLEAGQALLRTQQKELKDAQAPLRCTLQMFLAAALPLSCKQDLD